MTGHGQSSVQNDQVRVVAEIKSVNNRFLKTNIFCDLDAAHQAKLESLIKQFVQRGSVSLRIKSHFLGYEGEFRLNEPVIQQYWTQLSEIAGGTQSINVESILQLPGVIDEHIGEESVEFVWPAAEQAVTEALESLNEMRAVEGDVMRQDMQANSDLIADQLAQLQQLAPRVVDHYSKRMTEKINHLLKSFDVSIEASDIVKEIGIFADKCDISEETVRLGSHIEQFNRILNAEESNGKKLDFLVQEMLRETNTIGAKANDFEIAQHVIEIKTAIERIREMVQNVQ